MVGLGFPGMMFMGMAWIVAIVFVVWVIQTLNGIRRGIDRIADSVETYARDRLSHP